MRELYEKYKCRDLLKKLLKNQLDNTKKKETDFERKSVSVY